MAQDLKLQDLLDAGVHFGHQTHKWNPKMKKYIYGGRNGIYIIDLSKTVKLARAAYDLIKKSSSEGNPILFVGTKRQASDAVRKAADACGAFYVTNRWLGGMLTNHKTIGLSVDKLRKVEKMKETGDFNLLTKKERAKIEKNVAKLERNLGGIKNMRKLPGVVFVVDPNSEKIAVKEARRLGIPVVAITDTNCDPEGINFVVPGNDDATRSVALFAEYFAESVREGSKNKAKVGKQEASAKTSGDASLEKEIISKFEKDIDLQTEEEEDEIESNKETESV